ncbi:MAG: alpha/beta hydrolase fold domain-containing protein [Acidobacteria bacterium]|nr:alpha/beta hydrolase fold domain-containing protein [Acidobacteriota bacterium]
MRKAPLSRPEPAELWRRRRFLQVGSVAGLAACGSQPHAAESQPEQASQQTFAYKRVDGLDILADVRRAAGAGSRPVAVWIHGGALINGGREGVPAKLEDSLLEAGFTVVSIDYRLAPETKLPSIIEDLEDAFRWVAEQGPGLFGANPDRIVALGGSAGGYLTLTAGYRALPRPRALVSFWGYGDLIGPWYSSPSPHERHRRTVMTREEALAQVSGPPIANSKDRPGDGGAFYQHCRQHGIWPYEVSGWDPQKEPDQFTPYMPLRNVTADYPPTLLVHGTADTDVPYEQSQLMAAELARHDVEHGLITVEGAEHGLAGAEAGALDNAYAAATRFVERQAMA